MCQRNHVLERRVCWRQCSRITNLLINGPEIRCRDFVTRTPTAEWPIRIDTLYNTAPVPSGACVLCTPVLNNDYKEKLESSKWADNALDAASLELENVTTHAQNLGWTWACLQLVNYTQMVLDQKTAAAVLGAQELDTAYSRIQDSIRANIELSEESLNSDRPVFYYGPRVTSETSIPELNAPGQATPDAPAYPEHIIDWLVASNGTRQIYIWDFDLE